MRVSELLQLLSNVDPKMEVLAHAQHGDCRFQFFDIQALDVALARRSRDESGTPNAVLNDESGRPLALLTLTSEF